MCCEVMINCYVLRGYDKSGDKDRIYNIFSVEEQILKQRQERYSSSLWNIKALFLTQFFMD